MKEAHCLEQKNLTKRYGTFTALDGMNAVFTPGVYGILGPNGAGKSTIVVSDFPEQKGPQSTEKRYSEGWQSVGKDEVSSSNLDSSSNY